MNQCLYQGQTLQAVFQTLISPTGIGKTSIFDNFHLWREQMESRLLNSLKSHSYYEIQKNTSLNFKINHLFKEAKKFFSQSNDKKNQLTFQEKMSGYRELGAEYSDENQLPDLKESLSFRRTDYDLLMNKMNNNLLLDALQDMQSEMDMVSQKIIKKVAKSYKKEPLSTQNNSWLKINNYLIKNNEEREKLLEEHEDENMITLLVSDSDGLEIKARNGNFIRYKNDPKKILVITGGILGLLTGNEIKPLFHRVANIKAIKNKMSMMYFVHPDERIYIAPWVKNTYNEKKDIARISLNSPANHGLPKL